MPHLRKPAGYRMALKELLWSPVSTGGESAALVPARVLNESAKSMTAGERVEVSLSAGEGGDGLIGFEGEGTNGVRQITTRLLDGEFPKVRHLMSVQAATTVRASTTSNRRSNCYSMTMSTTKTMKTMNLLSNVKKTKKAKTTNQMIFTNNICERVFFTPSTTTGNTPLIIFLTQTKK